MSKKKRRHRSPEEKAVILRRHHLEKVPVSTVCEEEGLQPSVFYHWQRDLFARAPQVLHSKGKVDQGRSREAELEKKIAALEAKLMQKNTVIAEISQEYVELKKELGEL
ncbi:transposase [Haliangium sp.]|uniref:transposase n=1 Tax=Haliangium sp. TaxID=2663208 RepID=UPI003D0D1085